MEGKSMGEIQYAIFEAAKVGNTSVLDEGFVAKYGEAFRTPGVGNTIVHIAVRCGRLLFINKAIKLFPGLLQLKNNYNNTPLHEAAAFGTKDTVKYLLYQLQEGTNSSSTNATPVPPYLLELNRDGYTPFHVALRHRNISAAEELFPYVKDHPDFFIIKTNLLKETALHLYVKYCTGETFGPNIKVNDKQAFIYQLMEANFLAIFELDSEGWNPLMRAAEFGRVIFIFRVLLKYRQLINYQDSKGRCFLHHLRLRISDNARDCRDYKLYVFKEILKMPEVAHLVTYCQDQDGNTPLHLAILHQEFDVARLIIEHYIGPTLRREKDLVLSIQNNAGITVFDLITSGLGIPHFLKNLIEQARMGRLMGDEYYRSAEHLFVGVFRQHEDHYSLDSDIHAIIEELKKLQKPYDDEDYYSQDVDGKNIIHITIQHYHASSWDEDTASKFKIFIREAIERFPKLMYQKDSNDDTPLHNAARLTSNAAHLFLGECFDWYTTKAKGPADHGLFIPLWKVKDSKGHTPIHEAARTDNWQALFAIIKRLNHEEQTEALLDVNDFGETALHLITRYGKVQDINDLGHSEEDYERLLSFFKMSKPAAFLRDNEGLTPILRAAYLGRSALVKVLSSYYSKQLNICDHKGRNVLHLLCTSALCDVAELKVLIEFWAFEFSSLASELILSKDEDGNTPIHLAMMHQHFDVAYILMTHYNKVTVKPSNFMWRLKGTRNMQGKSIMNLIAYGISIPSNLRELIEGSPADMLKMDDKLYEAAKTGNLDYIKKREHSSLRSQSYDGSNLLHIALRHHQLPFIKTAITYDFHLIYKKDSKGNTPLHLAAVLQTNEASTFFQVCIDAWKFFSLHDYPPWKVRNSKGNTYLHEAARVCNYKDIFSHLLKDRDIMDINDQGETVLHVIVKYATNAARNFLENLPENMRLLVYIKDNEGFTPVLRALQYGRLGVATLLVQKCPGSVEISDKKGRTALHHLRALVVDHDDEVKDILPVWNEFFNHGGVDNLRIAQNEDGNTPLHQAIIDGDFTKTKFLMEKCLQSEFKRELDIINNDGHSVFDLASSQPHIPAMKDLVCRRYVRESKLMDKVMDDELYQAAIKGDISILESSSDDQTIYDAESMPPILPEAYFCSQTPGGSNIIHIALCHGRTNSEQFIATVLHKYPILSMRPDNNGDTPLHLAAKWKTGVSILKLLIKASQDFLQDENKKAFHVAPWAVNNFKGSFPIHEALQTGNIEAALALLHCDIHAASRVNDLGDTPLHSFAKNGFSISDDDADNFVKKLLKASNRAAYMRNIDGLTPLLSATKSGRLQVVRAILKCRPQSAYLRDPNGRTFLHLLRFTGEDVDDSFDGNFTKAGKQLFEIPEADAQRLVQDYDGNTPLHYAIINKNSVAAIVLTHRCLEHDQQGELGLVNKLGQTIPDLFALHDVPNEIIELIQKKIPKAVYLARSSYGIRKTEMKESANALSVVAALLATITFAAAFQVPGGFGDDGFPILLQKPAFAIFTMANAIAMCSSMLCLFLLLWVMGIGKIHGSLKVLDISINLLRLSFYLTLLTFTTGVFVATVNKSSWLGIFVCVLGFLTFLLTFKVSIKTVAKHGSYANGAVNSFINNVKSKCKLISPFVPTKYTKA